MRKTLSHTKRSLEVLTKQRMQDEEKARIAQDDAQREYETVVAKAEVDPANLYRVYLRKSLHATF